MKKRILIAAAGTATAWHIVNVIKSEYNDIFDVWVCDTNPSYLVPSANIADNFIQVPSVYEERYYEHMLNLLMEHSIDIYIPLIDFDLELFTCDNQDLINEGIISSGPSTHTASKIIDKYLMSQLLKVNQINTPLIYNDRTNNIQENANYLLKPRKGFGSQGVKKITGIEAFSLNNNDKYIIQELCTEPEVTVEIFNGNSLYTIVRERIEVKAGVCTKARVYQDDGLHDIVKSINNIIELPVASCIQFMKDSDNLWSVTDINLRLGAGTALSTAVGFQLTSAFLSFINDSTNFSEDKFFKENYHETYVVRYYNEMVTR